MDESPRSTEQEVRYVLRLVELGLRGVRAQGLRAVLSGLGIMVGIAAVLTILAAGEGAREETLRRIEALGTNTVYVRATRDEKGGRSRPDSTPQIPLTLGDAIRLKRIVSGVQDISVSRAAWVEISNSARAARGRLIATTPEHGTTAGLALRHGRFLSAPDGRQRRRVVVLGADAKRDLFGLDDAVGQSVRMFGSSFQVIGVLESRAMLKEGDAEFRATDINQNLYVPLESIVSSAEVPADWQVEEIEIVMQPDVGVAAGAKVVRAVLERVHRGADDYEVIVPVELLEQRRETERIFNAVLMGIAGLSLLVGGIGIMNIMLATVTERTPEIGLRRAVGATSRDIVLQFLVESATLTSLGGLGGVVLGLVCAGLVQWVGGWPVGFSFASVAGVWGISVLCGLVFGVYPALQAAAAEPIEALRYE